jgi:predicted aspartyl protease
MKKPTFAQLATRMILIGVTVAGVCERLQAQREIHFRLANNNLIVVSLKNGKEGPFDFILDTGADTTIVDNSIAGKLGFAALDTIKQSTLAGSQTVERGTIASLSAGPVQADHLLVLVEDLAAVRRIDGHIVGIVGQNFLSHFNYLLDYRKRLLRVEEGSEIANALQGNRVPLEARENRMIVGAEAQSQSRAVLQLMLDSGASSLILLNSARNAVGLRVEQNATETTTMGNLAMQTGRVDSLTVGSETLHNVVAMSPAIDPGERIGDGLLPTMLFDTVYVSNREGFVVLNPRMKRGSHLD